MRRTAWRQVLPALAVGIAFVAIGIGGRLAVWFGLDFLAPQSFWRNLSAGLVSLGLVLAMTVLARRLRSIPPLPGLALAAPPREAGRLLARGFGAGALVYGLGFGTALATGGIELAWRPKGVLPVIGAAASITLTTLLNAAWEEYTFRGWPFAVCARALGGDVVAVGLGTIFAGVHVLNPGWTAVSLASVWLGGLLLGYAFLASGSILLPIGLHAGWNLSESLLTGSRFWTLTRHPDPWLSGGVDGPGASAAGLAFTALAAALAVWLARRRATLPCSYTGRTGRPSM